MKTTIIIGISAVVILSGIIFIFNRSNSLPAPQSPTLGSLISKNHLVYSGYGTPESTLETAYWAMWKNNFDAFSKSTFSEQKMSQKEILAERKDLKNALNSFTGLQILAKKNLRDDKVELKFQTIGAGDTNCWIKSAIKINGEWKLEEDVDWYSPNWDKGGDVITFAQQ